MRLIELNPRWVNTNSAIPGSYQGISFNCPHCRVRRLAVWFDTPIGGGPVASIEEFQKTQDCDHPDHDPSLADTHFGIKHWVRSGDTFEAITLTPSIDASAFGCWHGHIVNGEAV